MRHKIPIRTDFLPNRTISLMFAENIDAANAAYQVGYESTSQFNREYKRMFGLPPKANVNQMKNI